MGETNWVKDPVTEHMMKVEHGFTFHYAPAFPVSKINRALSHKNNARFNAALSDHISTEYTGRMESGNPFFPVVILESNGQTLSGNHRVDASIKKGATTVGAYVVDKATPDEVDKFIRSINVVTNGQNLSDDERVSQAVHFVEKYCMSAKDAAVMMFGGRWEKHWTEINDRCKRAYVKEQLMTHGVKMDRIDYILNKTPGIITSLYTLNPREGHGGVKAPLIQRDAFQTICDTGMTGEKATAMITEVKKASNDKERREVIHKMAETIKTEEARSYSSDSTAFRTGLSKLHKLLCERDKELKITGFKDISIEEKEEQQVLVGRMKRIAMVFKRLEASYKKERKHK